jgi:tRNA(adenine34) deaminase
MWASLAEPWKACAAMAWEAYCAGCVPIGAVITDPAGNLIAAGRNRLLEPRAVGPLNLAGVPLAHAEINALLALDYTAVNPRDCTLYTTTEPCPQCAGALVMCNLRHLCYASRDPWAGSADLFSLSPYIEKKKTRVEGPHNPLFEAVLIALQTEFFLREAVRRGRAGSLDPVTDALERIVPEGAALGRHLYRDRTLELMQADCLHAAEAFDLLAGMVSAPEAVLNFHMKGQSRPEGTFAE